MNRITLYGVIKNIKSIDQFYTQWILEYPSRLKGFADGELVNVYNYIGVTLFETVLGNEINKFKVGDLVEIQGDVIHNCDENGNGKLELKVFPKKIKRKECN